MSACFRLACVQVNAKNELVAIFEFTSELIENAVPSAFTCRTGSAHWHVLLQARAIETGCWVFAAA
ncbi:MAG: hypothetical protein VYA17_06655 [Pseudomonadota bacterium]|nr:hypothetical protein [Pseudomonadota bacterium]